MSNIADKIIEYLRKNRVSTTEVADCLGKSGVIENVQAVNRGHYVAAKVKWVYAHGESNWGVHEQICDLPEDYIVFVDVFECKNRAILGELVTKYILLYRGCKGLVVKGNVRDAAALIKENYPVWCEGFNPVGCFNKQCDTDIDEKLKSEHKEKYDETIMVCDDCGVVLIPKERHTEEFYEKLENIEKQEDIWFERLDYYKENTFEIVCQKKYLQDDYYQKRLWENKECVVYQDF